MSKLTETIRLRAPVRLTEALEEEAHQQMLTKSALARQLLARALGLLDQAGVGDQEQQEIQADG